MFSCLRRVISDAAGTDDGHFARYQRGTVSANGREIN